MRTLFAPFAALCLLALGACNTSGTAPSLNGASIGSIVGAGQQTIAAVCNEGQAIQAAASSPAGLAAAAQAGIAATKVANKLTTLNTTLQGACALESIAAPLAGDLVNQVMTASAGVLGTHAAPPALVAAAKAGG